MRCNRCYKRLKKAYYHQGRMYGPECIKKMGGIIQRSQQVNIKEAEDKNKNQMELF